MNQQYLLDIISRRKDGSATVLVRAVLTCLSLPYRIAIWIRNWRYDTGAGVKHVDATVISVGNLTTGGTGKTPHIAMLARKLSNRSNNIAIVSRGYGSQDGKPNDEAIELSWQVDVPHFQNADRVAAAELAIKDTSANCILLDDGFQHRRLARQLDIVLIDATCPFGYGALLPRGLLREPISSLKRADVVVLTRRNLVTDETRQQILDKVEIANPDVVVAETKITVDGLIDSERNRHSLSILHGPVLAVCGIGNPAGFYKTLSDSSVDVCGEIAFNDHHAFTEQDIRQIAAAVHESSATCIVCTLKDLVKIKRQQIGSAPIYALSIKTEFMSGKSEFDRLIDETIDASVIDRVERGLASSDVNAA